MQVKVDTPDLNPTLRRLAAMIRNKAAFVKNWANAAAKEARDTARAKPGRRWWRDLARSIRVQNIYEAAAEVSRGKRQNRLRDEAAQPAAFCFARHQAARLCNAG